ncbi:MAG TPA: hypothetical protein DEA08_38825 [Planctomycetes bacterium]|nr:hypothetical protein [Planctomycetota bacterium]
MNTSRALRTRAWSAGQSIGLPLARRRSSQVVARVTLGAGAGSLAGLLVGCELGWELGWEVGFLVGWLS